MARLEGNIGDSEDSYRYLEIPQANDNHKEATTNKYPQEWGEWKEKRSSQLTPVVRYSTGIGWPKEEIKATDIKTKKLIAIDGGFQLKSSPPD